MILEKYIEKLFQKKQIYLAKLKYTRHYLVEKDTHYSMYPLQGCRH